MLTNILSNILAEINLSSAIDINYSISDTVINVRISQQVPTESLLIYMDDNINLWESYNSILLKAKKIIDENCLGVCQLKLANNKTCLDYATPDVTTLYSSLTIVL